MQTIFASKAVTWLIVVLLQHNIGLASYVVGKVMQ